MQEMSDLAFEVVADKPEILAEHRNVFGFKQAVVRLGFEICRPTGRGGGVGDLSHEVPFSDGNLIVRR